jgi:hypothetical protein
MIQGKIIQFFKQTILPSIILPFDSQPVLSEDCRLSPKVEEVDFGYSETLD